MKLKTFTIAVALVLALFLFAQRRPDAAPHSQFRGIIDLTHPAGEHSPALDAGIKPAVFARRAHVARPASQPDPFSTRIDAPAEFVPNGWTVDKIPPERLLAPLIVIDVAGQVKHNPDYQLSADDIAAWEKENGPIPAGAVVMMRTGWADKWSSAKDYRDADANGVMHFPGFSPDAAKFLVEARNTIGLGTDTPSVDAGASQQFAVQRFTATRGVYHLENVADLWRVPLSGAVVLVAPAKIEGGAGGPVRILALLR